MNDFTNNLVSVTHPGAEDTKAPEVPFVYQDECAVFQSILDDFLQEQTRVEARRDTRKHRVDVEALRNDPQGGILTDETFIADRTVDRNIRQQAAPDIEFLTQSPTILDFFDLEFPRENFAPFSAFVSDIFRMGNWMLPWLHMVDARQCHGGAWIELVYNPELPQQAEIEYIKREDLILPMKATSVSSCERFARRYRLTKRGFKKLSSRYKFNPSVVHSILEHAKTSEDLINIYKLFLVDDTGCVHNAWMADKMIGATVWLRDPVKHSVGIHDKIVDPITGAISFKPVPLYEPPIFFIPLYAEEDETLLSIQGRAALDSPMQEAITAVTTSTVNRTVRSASFYPYNKSPGRSSDSRKNKAPITLQHGHLYEGELGVLDVAPPTNIALSVIQALSVRNSQETGQVDFAAMSRQDTAKRATEINAAFTQAQKLSNVTLTLLSLSVKPAYVLWLKVLKSAVDMGFIKPPPEFLPFFARVGNPALNITMSADITIVRRAQRAAKYIQFYGMVAGTPYAEPFYKTMLAELFPEEYPEWSAAVGETNTYKLLLSKLLELLTQTPAQAIPEQLRPTYAAAITEISSTLNPAVTAPDGSPVETPG